MKMKKKWLALGMALVMLTEILSACGSGDGEKKSDAEGEGQQETMAEGEGQQETVAEAGVHLPVTDEKVEFSMWAVWANDYLSNPSECLAVQELEKLTNVHINYTVVLSQEAKEKFGLMIASGSTPDMVRQANQYYTGGIDKAIDDGIFRDVTDEVQQYMPNYLATVQTHPEALKGYVNDNHRNVVVWGLNGNDDGLASQKTYLGLLIRQDWLDDCGLAMPETIDDWHTVLTAFKEQKGAEAPLMIGETGTIFAGAFTSAFGVMPEFYVQDGKVKYGPAEEGYKDFLDTFKQWYAEGLIDPNFTANIGSGTMADNSYMATGKAGAGNSLFIYGGNFYTQTGMSQDANLNFVGAPLPVMNKGDEPMSCYNGSRITGDDVAFAKDIEHLDVALKWLDYQYTDEGMVLNNYGIQDKSYTLDEGGSYQYKFTDEILNNPEYSPADALKFYCSRIPDGRYNWRYEEQFYDESVLAIEDVWSQANRDWLIAPEITMTEEEGNRYNAAYTNVKTLVDEKTVKYIMGSEDIPDYDAFVESLYQFGLQDCLDAKQAAYERYMAR